MLLKFIEANLRYRGYIDTCDHNSFSVFPLSETTSPALLEHPISISQMKTNYFILDVKMLNTRFERTEALMVERQHQVFLERERHGFDSRSTGYFLSVTITWYRVNSLPYSKFLFLVPSDRHNKV